MSVTPIPQTTGATLLIVDDDRSAREGLRSVFENAGHNTIGVPHALSALRLLHKQMCDLVVLDVELPEVDGRALCRLLRAQPAMTKLPVVVFSADGSEGRKVEAFTAGADDYIVKPSTPGELVSRVNSHLNFAQRESELIGSNRELSFLADLGRGLLRAILPEQVAGRVAGAIYEGTNAAQSATLYLGARESAATLAREVDRRTAESEMQQRFTEAIIDTLPLSLYAIDRDYKIVAWNRNRELGELGLPRGEALGRNIFEVLTKQSRELLEREFAKVFATGEIHRVEQESITESGDTNNWLISKIPMRADEDDQVSHVITVGENITARVKAHRAVARAEKLAAVGRLAAGVVHEINNPLATIAACAESLEKRIQEGAFSDSPDAEDLREYLGLIRDEAFRCKTITNGLLNFSRLRAGQREPVDMREVLKATARLVTHQQRGDNIQIVIEAAAGLPNVSGDIGQLQQAVIALATNAIDAIPQGGTLTLRAIHSNSRVLVQVIDVGIGIEPENMTEIFDPFFTTKDVGRGTGLGLAVCYGILSDHGGRLDVRSTVGVGTTFTITLPIADE